MREKYSITKGYSWSKEELHSWYTSDDMLYTANWYKDTDKATKKSSGNWPMASISDITITEEKTKPHLISIF